MGWKSLRDEYALPAESFTTSSDTKPRWRRPPLRCQTFVPARRAWGRTPLRDRFFRPPSDRPVDTTRRAASRETCVTLGINRYGRDLSCRVRAVSAHDRADEPSGVPCRSSGRDLRYTNCPSAHSASQRVPSPTRSPPRGSLIAISDRRYLDHLVMTRMTRLRDSETRDRT